ncbi:TnsA endonuclease N-terminal domain-containing protein [Geobacter sp. SVR]|uniref:TnsA endonuclease N-terminal domain-containing protein n=1 Tax=Geobacter sp. SVR TaxID=2495594 RepID=UPI00143F04F0|nr:TnsA endonuclease N-terminal domain-containing protein [Geobacter sp. SVR]BCS51777.1 hypothetical protein GSVR_00850 [Geobacter sp. SVR]GCF87036.1 hypothetical protein GSbR_36360 [Geobacter sp. SVR]
MDSLFGKPPARRIRPSKCANTGVRSSLKNGKGLETESSLEHDFLVLLDFDNRVERYEVQPVTLRWVDNGNEFIYTPDVLVKYTDDARDINPSLKPTLYEVKPHDVLKRDWRKFEPKFRHAMSWARENGVRFKIITEKRIRTPFLDNAQFLLRYHSSTFPYSSTEGSDERYVLNSLKKTGETSVKTLLLYMSQVKTRQAELIPWIWRLILEEKIGTDLDKPLTMTSTIWLAQRERGV